MYSECSSLYLVCIVEGVVHKAGNKGRFAHYRLKRNVCTQSHKLYFTNCSITALLAQKYEFILSQGAAEIRTCH